ncbi:lysylphosphatidylglycerol synthase transmembrane domain-containing protein [uncultured Methanomethylovorans sp.]|uniref:lysylphosphatidylglycerol synthase transmembrane domain-containing protein n=1 Tax=uncultured Methanomethylovorans sp. TaxID=183759 RepID=UPI002AA758CB|nr:lysylphosphatidylglycerol synthase transmembrane domain-containing protein [uncultured Methanomethylovorans sp.]
MNNPKNNSASYSTPKLRFTNRSLLQLLLLGLAVHIILPQFTTLENSMQVIRTMVLWAVLFAVGSQIVSYIGSGYLLKATVAIANQRLSVTWGIIISLAASSIGVIAGGMVGNAASTYKWMRKMGINEEGAALAGTLPSFYNNVLLLFLSIFGMIHLLLVNQLSISQSMIFIIILSIIGLCAGFVIYGYNHRQQFTSILIGFASCLARLSHKPYTPRTTEEDVSKMFDSMNVLRSGGWRGPAAGAIMNTGFDMMTLYFLFTAAGNSVSLGVLLTGYGLPLLFGKMAFFIPGGVGIVEGTMAAIYGGLGVQSSIIVLVVLVYRMISFWLPTLLGFPLAAYLQNSNNHFK